MILVVQNDVDCPAGLYGALLNRWAVPHGYWHPYAGEAEPSLAPWRGVIVLGGFPGVHDEVQYPFLAVVKRFMGRLVAARIPCLGICLGGQLLAQVLGGTVHARRYGEKGCRQITLTDDGRNDPLFVGLPPHVPVFQWHTDSFEIPEGALHLAFSQECIGQSLRCDKAWGVQFHPEVDTAVVAAWCGKSGANSALLAEFRAQQNSLYAVGEKLLLNFLCEAAVVTSHSSFV